MDSNQVLSKLFNQTINPSESNSIKQAEEQLKNALSQPGFMQALMVLSNNQQENINIRQAATAHLKLIIQRHWNSKQTIQFSDNDKDQVKENLHQALIISMDQPKIKSIYEAIIEKVVQYDFPYRWQNLSQNLLSKIQNPSSENEFYGSLIMFKCIVKCFYAYMGEDRKDIDVVIENYLPAVSDALQKSLSQNTPEAIQSVLTIFKIIYYSIRFNLPSYFNNKQNLDFWMNSFEKIYQLNLSSDLIKKSDDEDEIQEKQKNILWKLKTKTCQILQRFIQKLNHAEEKDNSEFHTNFQQSYSLKFLKLTVELLQPLKNQFIPNKTIVWGLKYLYSAVKLKSTFQNIQPHLLQIMTDICIPNFSISKFDIELFKNDPEEYIRKSENYFLTPLIQSQDLVTLICKKSDQNKNPYLIQILKYLVDSLNSQDQLQQEALLHCFGHLHQEIQNYIEKKKIQNSDIEQIISQYVEPNLANQNPLLRQRALYVLSKFSNLEIKNKNLIPSCIQKVCACISDEYLPVKIQAAISINCLLNQQQAVDMLRPELNTILNKYIEIMQRVDNEGVVLALEGIVQNYSKEIQPYAIQLVNQLAMAYLAYAKKSMQQAERNDNEEYDGSTEMTAASCLSAIKSILAGDLQEQAYTEAVPILIPVFNFVFSSDGCDYIDEGADILNIILYNSNTIDNQLWFFFPTQCYLLISIPEQQLNDSNLNLSPEQTKILYDARENYGLEFAESFLPCLKNFIQKGFNEMINQKDFFGVSFIDLIFQVIVKFNDISKNGNSSENLSINSLLVTLLENGIGKIDHLFPRIFQFALNNLLDNNAHKYLQLISLETVCICFFYNPTMSLQYLQSQNLIDQTLSQWFTLIPKFKFDYQKIKSLLGMTSMLKLGKQNIPQSVVQSLNQFMKSMVKLTSDIVEARDQDVEDCDSDEDDEIDKDAFDSALEVKGKKVTIGKFDNKDLDNDLDDFDEDDEFRENMTYDCPLEDTCEILFLRDTLNSIQQSDLEFYNQIEAQLSQEDKNTLLKNFQTANEQDIECKYLNLDQKTKQEEKK